MLTLPNDHLCRVTIVPADAHGNPVQITGAATWYSSRPGIVDITNISADSLSADIVPIGPVGTVEVIVEAEGNPDNLGAGVTAIYGVLDVKVIPENSRQVHMGTGLPTPIPPPQPPPTITALSPATAPANTDIPTFTIDGTGFDAGITIYFGSAYVKPASQTSTSVSCHIGAVNVQFPGVLDVSVLNGDGQSSGALPFTIT
jgi:hypothetical protein